MARYAIGDIQGCMASLERLLAQIGFVAGRDDLWLTGDLVNRGPRSLDVLRWAKGSSAITCVLGNHDLHLLGRVANTAGEKKRDTLAEVLAAPDRDVLIDWLRSQPLLVRDDRFALVHAGLHPQWTIGEAHDRAREIEHELHGPNWRALLGQLHGPPPVWSPRLGGGERWRAILAYLVRARTLHTDGRVEPDFDGAPADAPPDCLPWFALPAPAWATHTIVFGHWAALGLSLGPHHIGLDTGCVWGKSLTAIKLDDRTLFQVKAVEKSG